MAIDRRGFLRSGAATAALVSLGGATGCATAAFSHPGASPRARGERPFLHGVASGDPQADRVILWTRVSPESDRVDRELVVEWWIAQGEGARDVVARGEAVALPERDFTVKVDAEGLEPGVDYHFGFRCEGEDSPVGRTRTLAVDGAERVRFAVVSCANLPQGYFNAYACIARRDDLDAVLHLGDYLYEYGNGQYGDGTALGRLPDPMHEIVSLEDYRRRHARYKLDPDLQAAHARHPWITIWDDHEIANDAWMDGAQNHTEGDAPGDANGKGRGEGAFSARKLAAIRAYHEWMPIRDLPNGIFRRFRFGRLADLVLLDTRLHGRDLQVRPDDPIGAADPGRALLGADQTAWLLAELSDSKNAGIRWRVVGQQVVFSPLTGGGIDFNVDAWDGYRANRRAIVEHLERERIEDVVILTGDVHSAWAIDVPGGDGNARGTTPGAATVDDDGRKACAVEIVTPAVSSRPLGRHPQAEGLFEDPVLQNPHVRYSNLFENGFVLLELDEARARAEFFFDESVEKRGADCRRRAVFETRAGAHHLVRVGAERDEV